MVSKISNSDKTIPYKAILQLTSLEEESKSDRIFLSIEKDYHNKYILFFKKKYHYNTSTIADYLTTALDNQYDSKILYIFDLYY